MTRLKRLPGVHLVSGPVVFVRFIEHSPNFIVAQRVILGADLRTRNAKVGVWSYGRGEYVTKAGKTFVSDTLTRGQWRERVESIWDTREKI